MRAGAGLLAALLAAGLGGGFGAPGGAREWTATAFPLSVSADRSHLRDGAGRPLLIVGDAAWSLIAQLSREDAALYLRDRQARGFNALLVNLIEHEFSANPPANAYDARPFHGDAFETPNEAYFDHAEWVLRRAEALGFAVFLAPAYIGAGGGGQGWWAEMRAAGPERLRRYGRYLGARFGGLGNIVWTQGGDEDAPDPSLVAAIAAGIGERDPDALQTAHSRRDTVTAAHWAGAPWLDLDTAYTYGDVFEAVARQTRDDFDLPVIMIETLYENEHGTTAPMLREAAYGAIMAGAAGFVFGNNPIWHFSREGLFDAPRGWKAELAGAGSESMGRMRAFFEPLDWWKLRADSDGALCGANAAPLKCAVAQDGGFAVVYAPRGGEIRVGTDALFAGGTVCATWRDPADGAAHPAGAPAARGETLVATPPQPRNARGFDDWLLLLAICE